MRLSYSSINTYETCPAKFKFQYEDRLPAAPPPRWRSATRSTRPCTDSTTAPCPSPRPSTSCYEMLEAVWVSEGYTDESEERMYRDHGRQVLAQYHRENVERFRDPGRPRTPVHDRGRRRRSSTA